MKIPSKKIGFAAIISLAIFSGGLAALPNNAYEITYRDDNGNVVGFDAYYCGRNHGGLDWGIVTDNVEYLDLGPCNLYNPGPLGGK